MPCGGSVDDGLVEFQVNRGFFVADVGLDAVR